MNINYAIKKCPPTVSRTEGQFKFVMFKSDEVINQLLKYSRKAISINYDYCYSFILWFFFCSLMLCLSINSQGTKIKYHKIRSFWHCRVNKINIPEKFLKKIWNALNKQGISKPPFSSQISYSFNKSLKWLWSLPSDFEDIFKFCTK